MENGSPHAGTVGENTEGVGAPPDEQGVGLSGPGHVETARPPAPHRRDTRGRADRPHPAGSVRLTVTVGSSWPSVHVTSPENLNWVLFGLGAEPPPLGGSGVVVIDITSLVKRVPDSMVTLVASVVTSRLARWLDCVAEGHTGSILVGTVTQAFALDLTEDRTRSLRAWVGVPPTSTVSPDADGMVFAVDVEPDGLISSDVVSGVRYVERDDPPAMS